MRVSRLSLTTTKASLYVIRQLGCCLSGFSYGQGNQNRTRLRAALATFPHQHRSPRPSDCEPPTTFRPSIIIASCLTPVASDQDGDALALKSSLRRPLNHDPMLPTTTSTPTHLLQHPQSQHLQHANRRGGRWSSRQRGEDVTRYCRLCGRAVPALWASWVGGTACCFAAQATAVDRSPINTSGSRNRGERESFTIASIEISQRWLDLGRRGAHITISTRTTASRLAGWTRLKITPARLNVNLIGVEASVNLLTMAGVLRRRLQHKGGQLLPCCDCPQLQRGSPLTRTSVLYYDHQ